MSRKKLSCVTNPARSEPDPARRPRPGPLIGIIKSVMKFRQFLLRRGDHVSGERDVVCLAYHVKRMHRMQYT